MKTKNVLKQFWKFRNIAGGAPELLLYGDIESSQSWWDEGGAVYADAFVQQLQALGNVPQITVRINSRGGDIFAAMAIFTELKTNPARIVAVVDGLAASAATFILMAADEIQIPTGAFVMIHDPLAELMGSFTADDLQESAATLDVLKQEIVAIYAARTGLSASDVSDMMAKTTWMGADSAIENGFADQKIDEEIETKVDMKEKVIYMNKIKHDLSAFPTMPELEHAENIQSAIAGACKNGIVDHFVALAGKMTNKGKAQSAGGENGDGADGAEPEDDPEGGDGGEETDETGKGGKGKKKNAAPLRVSGRKPAAPAAAAPGAFADELPDADDETHAQNAARLEAACPNLVARIRDDAALEERERLQAIDELAGQVPAALVAKAKYEEPMTAQELAYEAMQSSTAKGSAYLASRAAAAASSGVKGVKAAPEKTEDVNDEQARAEIGDFIAQAANRRLGYAKAGR